MSKKTIAYTRVSTAAQLEGNGVAQQRQSIAAWAAVKGVRIDEFITESESGTREDREEILLLKERAQRGEIGVLVIDRMDRLGRKLVVSERLYEFFRSCGVDVRCVSSEFDEGPAGTLMRQIFGAVAEFQRTEWLGRMAQCRKVAVRKKGTFQGGRAPHGFRALGNGKLAVDPTSARLVIRIYELRATGRTMRQIAELLAEEGFHTANGNPVSCTQVQRILSKREVYQGLAPAGSKQALEPGVVPKQPALLRVQ